MRMPQGRWTWLRGWTVYVRTCDRSFARGVPSAAARSLPTASAYLTLLRIDEWWRQILPNKCELIPCHPSPLGGMVNEACLQPQFADVQTLTN